LRIDLSHTTDEAHLVKCCKNNEPAAQHILYNKYVDDMMVLCLRYIPQPEDAKEVLMDGFLSFFRNMAGFQYLGEGSVKAWLKKIIINQCLMFLRKSKPVLVQLEDGDRYDDKETDDDILGHLTAKEILLLLQQLPDGYRTIFNLYVFEDMGHKEIAALLNITESTSKSQLHRARAMMKDKVTVVYGTRMQGQENRKN
jgi:RNA polymerase sigma-70 factor, ECF subfamily